MQPSTTKIDTSEKSNVNFEKRREITCYFCHEVGHVVARCPKLTQDKSECNNIVGKSVVPDRCMNAQLEAHKYVLRVNNQDCYVLRDSGATVDVIHSSLIQPNGYNGKHVWVEVPFIEHRVCLPLANVVISGSSGMFKTEAAITTSLSKSFHCILSNASAAAMLE